MNTTEKAIAIGLGLVVAVGLFAGAAFGLPGQTSATNQRGGWGMMSGGSSYGGVGMMGPGSNAATSAPTHSGGIMGGMWGVMGDRGLAASGEGIFMGCLHYMEHVFGLGANGTAS